MNDSTTRDQGDDDILVSDVSDETLEKVAATTNDAQGMSLSWLYTCCGVGGRC